MQIFKKKQPKPAMPIIQTARTSSNRFIGLDDYIPLQSPENKLYDSIREGVPIIDAAINKIIRLTGGFKVVCNDKEVQKELDYFVQNVKVGGSQVGLESFICTELDNLLMYGNAIGEIVLNSTGDCIMGVYNAALSDIEVKKGSNPLAVELYIKDDNFNLQKIKHNELILFSSLSPKASDIIGVSVIRSLPFVSTILLKIFSSMEQNFERIGNLRYAVTYKPSNDTVDKAYAKERAMAIAKEWADGMTATKNGHVTDFISVGDVNIKVIGADNQLIDTEIPVRQLLEQIVAKLSIPPFLLGLSWSSTERMSKQQADILTSELEYFRRLLTIDIVKICRAFLRLKGIPYEPIVEWDIINLQDEIEHARAELYKAQTVKIFKEIGEATPIDII